MSSLSVCVFFTLLSFVTCHSADISGCRGVFSQSSLTSPANLSTACRIVSLISTLFTLKSPQLVVTNESPPRAWFSWSFTSVKREGLLPTFRKCLLKVYRLVYLCNTVRSWPFYLKCPEISDWQFGLYKYNWHQQPLKIILFMKPNHTSLETCHSHWWTIWVSLSG